ncbi:hypothetical protein TNCV_75521 [Trichonephila clavipes]|nr:hypothetical protein TNCV_75521 [Trichonephila clavipes]
MAPRGETQKQTPHETTPENNQTPHETTPKNNPTPNFLNFATYIKELQNLTSKFPEIFQALEDMAKTTNDIEKLNIFLVAVARSNVDLEKILHSLPEIVSLRWREDIERTSSLCRSFSPPPHASNRFGSRLLAEAIRKEPDWTRTIEVDWSPLLDSGLQEISLYRIGCVIYTTRKDGLTLETGQRTRRRRLPLSTGLERVPGRPRHTTAAVSDLDSLPPCTNPGCSHHVSPKNTPKNTPPSSPTRRNNQQKRKDEDDFEFPPLRKIARKTILQDPDDIGLKNQFSLLPSVIIKQVSGQLAPPTANTLLKTIRGASKKVKKTV